MYQNKRMLPEDLLKTIPDITANLIIFYEMEIKKNTKRLGKL